MKKLLLFACIIYLLPQILKSQILTDFKNTTIDKDYAYQLPYEKGKAFKIIQGYNSTLGTHHNQNALDFKMPVGTPICAARDGVVFETVDYFTKGGPSVKYEHKGNHIYIRHSDGTFAVYYHLKYHGVAVKTGQKVKKGEIIGYSGKTGQALVPHLHFKVRYTKKGSDPMDIPTKFMTPSGTRLLKNSETITCI